MGSVNIDNTGSGADVTLSSDGTDLLLDGTAIGGGGGGAALELYAENPSSPTAPSATGTNSVAIGTQSEALGTSSVAIGEDCVAASGTFRAVAIGSNSFAYGNDSMVLGAVAQAASNESTAIGYGAQTFGGVGAFAIGESRASGADSLAAAIASASSSYGASGTSSIALGNLAKASSAYATALGSGCVASGSYSIAMGLSCTASAVKAISIGDASTASKNNAVALGNDAKSDIKGKFAYSGQAFISAGDAQTGTFVLLSDTTDATAEPMTTDKSSGSTDDQIILPNNSAYFFSGTCVARESAASGTDMGAWEFKGCIRREANAGTTTLVSSTIDEFSAPTGWAIALSADTTNGGLAVTVTGAASTNIRWVATVHTSEVTYA